MEVNANSSKKEEANEVVLVISGVESQSGSSSPKPSTRPIELEKSPSISQISNLTSPSAPELTELISTPSELPNIMTEKSILRSSFVKLKSRSIEPPHPHDTSASASKDALKPAPSVPRICSVLPPAAEEENDEDMCETVNLEYHVLSGKTKVVLAQQVTFMCITGLLIASLTIGNMRNTVIWHMHLWGWCLLMLAIFSGRLATDCLINVLVFLVEEKYLLKKKVLYFLYAMKDSAKVFAWLCLVLLAWVLLIKHGVKRPRHTTKILNWVTRALFSCLVGAALWLIKIFLMKLLSSSFQCKGFFDRIHDCLFKLQVIRTLSRPAHDADTLCGSRIRGILSLRRCIKGVVNKLEKVNIEKLIKMKPDEFSAWTTKKLIYMANSWDLLTFTDSLDEAEQQDKEITDENKAKDAIKAIFKNVAKPGSTSIEEDDLSHFMLKEQVEKFLTFFPEAKETRKITKPSFKKWLVSATQFSLLALISLLSQMFYGSLTN